MNDTGLLYRHEIPINEKISITIPTISQILKEDGSKESEYYNLVFLLTAMPIDMMVQLDMMGIDFTTIDGYDLFLIVFELIKSSDTSLVFGNLDLSKFVIGVNEENKNIALINAEDGVVIDKGIYERIADTLRKIHHLEKNTKRPGNKQAKDYMLKQAKRKYERAIRKKNKDQSSLESLIIALVNTEQFKYDFDSVRSLTLYQFNECVRQIKNKIDYDNRMYGIYAGTVDIKNINEEDLNWLSHK